MQCLSERCLARTSIFQAARGFRHVLGRKMRFNGLLLCNISRYSSQLKCNLTRSVFHKVDSYGRASRLHQRKLFCKVSTSMYHDGFDELFDEEKDDFDASLARKQFPSIMIGQSSPVELYDGVSDGPERSSIFTAEICNDHLVTKVVDPNMLYDSLGKVSKDFNSFSSYEIVSISDQGTPGSTSSLSILQSGISSSKEEKSQNKVKSEAKQSGDDSSNRGALHDQLHSGPFESVLDKSISCVPALSKKQCSQLENCGLHTIRKLLSHFPRTYADLQNAQSRIDDGQYLIFVGKVISSRGIKANCSLSFLEVIVGCEVAESGSVSEKNSGSKRTIYLHLKKFFRGTRFTYQPFLRSLQEKQKAGDIVCVSGKVRTMRTKYHYEMREYSLDLIRDDDDESACAEGRPYPIYPSKGGLSPKLLGDIIARVLDALHPDIDPIPKNILQMFGLQNLRDAYIGIHQPANFNEADLARRRIIFDEFFYLQLGRLFQMLEGLGTWIEKGGLLDKYRNPTTNAVLAEKWCTLTKKFLKTLPYSLTSSQLSAVSEIIWDLKRQVPMNRLLQGDVGCGKTVVAFLACMEVIGSGYQAAFMVPTELLAIQHHDHLLNLLEKMDMDWKPSVALLTGSTPTKKARQIREGLQSGEIALVIGTHSLIAEKVEFSSLRIAVVDEQHRFGVIQRGRFNSKLYYNSVNSRLAENDSANISKGDLSMAPHVLAMTATPIPRTLALALYGDMSLTQITDLPPGRKPIDTFIVEGNETGFEEVYQMMREELDSGGRVYVVYPIIEQSEQLPQLRGASADLEVISNRFEGFNCGLLHGRMKSDEKDDALRRFRSGETQILLSTLVIEIGVDVPEASMMVVMNAERFGLAQLHQLRGRVGRGVRKSKCVLLSSTSSGLGRLEVLEKSSDGFHLANMDLLLRGPGDLLGRKQSGHLPEFPIARLEIDGNILQEAHLAALAVLSDSHNLESFPALKAELSMRQPLCLLGD